MLFNSFEFLLFFIIIYGLYLIWHKQLHLQNTLLLIASCIFYGAWSWKFLILLFFSAWIDYYAALHIDGTDNRRIKKRWLAASIVSNLSILGFFKYFAFFTNNFREALAFLGFTNTPEMALNIILPLGISFYTFQSMSYAIDVYRGNLKPVRHFSDFVLFVMFFPQLVAGPIERATHLLPQLMTKRTLSFSKFAEGCYLTLWGLFQKTVVADGLAGIVNPIFAAGGPYHPEQVLLGVYAFSFQILCDFSGYSNIARGLGKMMGFDIMENFRLPYFAVNPSDFWQRWHISLSSWLRDYLYVPLGGNRKGTLLTYRNLFLTMLLGGLWHGAAWTFIAWGAYHGLLLISYRLLAPFFNKISPGQALEGIAGKVWKGAQIVFFYHLICIGWLFFRANSMGQVFEMLHSFSFSLSAPHTAFVKQAAIAALLVLPIWWVQLRQFQKNDLYFFFKWHWLQRGAFYALLLIGFVVFASGGVHEFIYFQF
jgi:alginate O-acetyltransferase complex protein AlgI